MSRNEYQIGSSQEKLREKTCFFLLCVAFLVRLYFYIFPKNLWLDEAMIALAIDKASWSELLRGQLSYNQSCPLFFAIVNKVLNVCTSYSPHALYFLPTAAGIVLLVLLVKLCRSYEKNSLLALICIALAASCKIALYYSSEFKQYIFEGLVTVFLLLNFIRDLHSGTLSKKIISYKYPLLFGISFLISTPSVFVSAAIFYAIFIYLLKENQYNFYNTLRIICSRYVVFIVICLAYYFFYLKNDAMQQFMYMYWKNFFIPHNISAWPDYACRVVKPIWCGMFTTIYSLKSSFPIMILFSFISGYYFVYKRNRYEFVACILPFVFAVIAAFGIYPPGHEGLLGARLSFYLFPIIIFVSSVGLYNIFNKFFAYSKKPYWQYIVIILICCSVLCINFKFLTSGLAHQQTFSLFETVHEKKKDSDYVLIYSYSEPALSYWEKISNKKIDYTILQHDIFNFDDKKIEKQLPQDVFSHNKLFIVYSHSWDGASEKMKKIFLNHGYHVETSTDVGAVLQIVSR